MAFIIVRFGAWHFIGVYQLKLVLFMVSLYIIQLYVIFETIVDQTVELQEKTNHLIVCRTIVEEIERKMNMHNSIKHSHNTKFNDIAISFN